MLGAITRWIDRPEAAGTALFWRLAPALFALGTVLMMVTLGVPDQRDVLAIWLLAGLLAFSRGDVRGWTGSLVRDWGPFFGLLIAYDALRGAVKGLSAPHYLPQLDFDRAVFGQAPTVWLQHHLWHGRVGVVDVAAGLIYATHFFAVPVLAAVLWKRNRARFRQFVALVATLSAGALLTFALYPAAPPWMASQNGLLAGVTRILPHVWPAIGLHFAGTIVEGGYRYANDVAAVPSLHAAYALMVALTLWPLRRRWSAPVIGLYPVAMGFALVYTGEHYVSDVLLGWLYAVGALLAVRAMARARARVRARGRGRAPAWAAR